MEKQFLEYAFFNLFAKTIIVGVFGRIVYLYPEHSYLIGRFFCSMRNE